MERFDVASRCLELHKNYFLEASAGTGKTYSIENLVVRLLIEEEGNFPLSLDEIVVVTFTRAATQELRCRVRRNIEKAYSFLKNQLHKLNLQGGFEEDLSTSYDYLKAICDEGVSSIKSSVKRLEVALSSFEEAQIFTIHSFCFRVLVEHSPERALLGSVWDDKEPLPLLQMLEMLKDFLRTEIVLQKYCFEQIRILLNKHSHNIERLLRTLLRFSMNGSVIEGGVSFHESFEKFEKAMQMLIEEASYSSGKLLNDFSVLAPHYLKMCDRSKKPLPQAFEEMKFLFSLFEKESWSPQDFDKLISFQAAFLKKICPENQKKNAKLPSDDALHYPCGISKIREILLPIIDEASSYLLILARISRDAGKMLRKTLNEKEMMTPDDILKEMRIAIEDEEVVRKIKKKYRAAIIDEFQDTDRLQWEIFRLLFHSDKEGEQLLYLVGDPKQSIYGFRRADIYTYREALRKLGEEHRASLDTNYRSCPSLVNSLNYLFSTENTPKLFELPRTEDSIDYFEVRASQEIKEIDFKDKRESLHFFVAEGKRGRSQRWPTDKIQNDTLFPFVVQEIQRLVRENDFKYQQFAILVRDRFQGEEIQKVLKSYAIPALTKRSVHLVDSLAFPAFYELLSAILDPLSLSKVGLALAGKIIGRSHHDVKKALEGKGLEETYSRFFYWKEVWTTFGFTALFREVLSSSWRDDRLTLEEELLMREEGLQFFLDLHQVAELFTELSRNKLVVEELLRSIFDEMREMAFVEDEKIKVWQGDLDAVNIMTLHMSKGLEFDVVFALGLANRERERKELVPDRSEDVERLVACDRESDIYRSFCDENDAEKMRILYVAMTRAKYRLYLPIVIEAEDKEIIYGSASPMELFLARFGKEIVDGETLYNNIASFSKEELREIFSKIPREVSIGHTFLEKEEFDLSKDFGKREEVVLIPPLSVKVPKRVLTTSSFSSLASRREKSSSFLSFVAPHDWECEEQSVFTLPSGKEIGNVIHTVFEKLPYRVLQQVTTEEELLPFVEPLILSEKAFQWSCVINKIVFNTVRTILRGTTETFSLLDVAPSKMFHEFEFLYSLASFPGSDELLKGFIDLVFQHNGFYYIIDWKSNWLGPSQEYYQEDHLKKAMKEHHYYLQGRIYSDALEKYLSLVEKRPFKECFGGVFYLFLRGINCEMDDGRGVYHFFPDLSKQVQELVC